MIAVRLDAGFGAAFLEERHRFDAPEGQRGGRRDDLGEDRGKPFGVFGQ